MVGTVANRKYSVSTSVTSKLAKFIVLFPHKANDDSIQQAQHKAVGGSHVQGVLSSGIRQLLGFYSLPPKEHLFGNCQSVCSARFGMISIIDLSRSHSFEEITALDSIVAESPDMDRQGLERHRHLFPAHHGWSVGNRWSVGTNAVRVVVCDLCDRNSECHLM